jgi:hypothetical protein
MKIFRKEHCPNGRRHIYVCGIKVASYKKHVGTTKVVVSNELPLKYIANDRLPILLRDKFFEYTGKLPTEKLETLNEKIIWASMFDVTPLKVQCADKYAVRDYVKKIIGEKYLIKLLAKFDDICEVKFDKLPDKFVFKFSEGSGKVYLVPDKKKLDVKSLLSRIREWVLNDFWTLRMEMQYKDSVRKILVEEFLNTKIEYKLWMFHGKCEFIKIEIMNDFAENGKPDNQYGKYFYPDWSPADFRTIGTEPNFDISRPHCLDELICCAEKLAKPFEFVRVDFYETEDGYLKFGELTFSPAGGSIHFIPADKDKEFGKLYKISNH